MTRRRTQLIYVDFERAFTLDGCTKSMKEIIYREIAVFNASSILPPLLSRGVSWSGQQKRRPHCFRNTLMVSSTTIVFRTRILVTLLWYCVLLPSGLTLFVVSGSEF